MPKTSFPTPSRPYLYLPDGWDTAWKAAKNAVNSTTPSILTIGDSLTAGNHASNPIATGYPALIRASLAAKYPMYADFYASSLTNTYTPTIPTNTLWTYGANGTGARSNSSVYTVANAAASAFGTTGDFSFTTPYACTALDLIAYDINAAPTTWQYNVDNAGGTGLSTVTTTSLSASPYRVALSALANTTHVIRMGNGSGVKSMQLMGALTYTGASSGIVFGNWGIVGVPGINYQLTSSRVIGGGYKASSADAAHTYSGFGLPMGPTLAIILLGVNDCAGSNGYDPFLRSMELLAQGLRRGTSNQTSILFVGACNPDFYMSDQTTLFSNTWNWHQYLGAMQHVAESYNCGFVNMHAKWGETPKAQGFVDTSDQHPLDAGYTDIATTILGVL